MTNKPRLSLLIPVAIISLGFIGHVAGPLSNIAFAEEPIVIFDTDFALPAMPTGDGTGVPVCINKPSGLLVEGCGGVGAGTFTYSINALTCVAQDGEFSGGAVSCGSFAIDRVESGDFIPCWLTGKPERVTYICALELPNGALIEEIIAYGQDDADDGYMEASVYRLALDSWVPDFFSPTYAGTFQNTGIPETPGVTNFPIYLDSDAPHTVDGAYRYNIALGLRAPTPNSKFVWAYGFKVTYSIP